VSDQNFLSYADVDGLDLPELVLDLPAHGIDASQYDDILKLSHACNIHIGRLIIKTGGRQRENAIDFNRECQHIRIDYAEIEAGQQNGLTAKGGCEDIGVGTLCYLRAGGHCDIELGNWSDQSKKRTTGVVIERAYRMDGQRVRVRVGNGDWPTIKAGNVKRLWLQSLLLKLWLCFRA
jgi:hypothetical protein